MNFELSEEQELLRTTVRRFLADHAPIAGHVRPLLDDAAGTRPEVWDGLAGLGVLGLLADPDTFPDLVTAGVVAEEAGRALLPEPFLASSVGAAAVLHEWRSRPEAAELLASIADGSVVATVAVHEPAGRYSWRAPTARARFDGGWMVSGSKEPVLSATAARVALVTAATDDGIGIFAVELTDDARVDHLESIDRTRKLARVALDDAPAVRIDADGDPVEALSRAIDTVGLALTLDALGAASVALDITVEYAKQRHQFGVPIGSFQAIQHLCADMLRDVEMVRVGAYYALWAGQAAGDHEFHRAATMAQAYAADVLPSVAEAAIQVFGGIGFTWEHDVHLYFKRVLSASALFGNAASHYAELADLVLD